ncbi:arginyltransferase [Desulfogranum mediterraneum]|uniref:arginyltransferase n=1 Tax=Desulfogranum mediterraneum TaxID=160661 RepID=UPI0005515991|nr:arginyltransferase [Desulfogranum mediterraneum]
MKNHERDQRQQLPENQALEAAIEQYFVDVTSRCPYGMDQQAIYHQGMCGRLDDRTMGSFLAQGYRRNGNAMYNMRCPGCSLCVPIRIRPEQFTANRNQRRVLKKNRDVVAGVAPLTMSRENLNLLESFLTTRFPESNNHAEGYYTGFFITSITRCFEIRYRVGEQLIGVAVVDGAPGWLNAVYFYFDPEQSWRSPGTMNILYLLNFCRNQQIDLLYLGYWIKDLGGMDYKKHFRPHELLVDGSWQLKR